MFCVVYFVCDAVSVMWVVVCVCVLSVLLSVLLRVCCVCCARVLLCIVCVEFACVFRAARAVFSVRSLCVCALRMCGVVRCVCCVCVCGICGCVLCVL